MKNIHRMARVNHKLIVLMVAVLCLGFVLGGCSAKVDDKLLGSWQLSSYLGYTETWIFRKDGTFDMVTTGTGILADGINMDNWYYRVEDGQLKISPNGSYSWPSVITYEYQFGITETGTQCLILMQLHDDGRKDTSIYNKID